MRSGVGYEGFNHSAVFMMELPMALVTDLNCAAV